MEKHAGRYSLRTASGHLKLFLMAVCLFLSSGADFGYYDLLSN